MINTSICKVLILPEPRLKRTLYLALSIRGPFTLFPLMHAATLGFQVIATTSYFSEAVHGSVLSNHTSHCSLRVDALLSDPIGTTPQTRPVNTSIDTESNNVVRSTVPKTR